jgi:hypothetical protein
MNHKLLSITLVFVLIGLFAAVPWQSFAQATPINEEDAQISKQNGNISPTDSAGDNQLYQYGVSDSVLVYLPIVRRGKLPCTPLYSDNFNTPGSGWPVSDDGNVLREYNAGEYRILVRPKDWSGGASPGVLAAEYSMAVDLRNINNVVGSYGIAFESAQNGSTTYTFEIYSDGWFGLYRWSPSLTTLAEAPSAAINLGSASNHLKVERYGSAIKAYVNGTLVANVTDGTYTGSRYFGLVAFTYPDNASVDLDVRYDNFTVYPIACTGLN